MASRFPETLWRTGQSHNEMITTSLSFMKASGREKKVLKYYLDKNGGTNFFIEEGGGEPYCYVSPDTCYNQEVELKKGRR